MTPYGEVRKAADRLGIRRWLGLWLQAVRLVRSAAPAEVTVVTVVQVVGGLALVGQLALAGYALKVLTDDQGVELATVAAPLAAAAVLAVVTSLLTLTSQELSLVLTEKVARAAHGRVLDVAVAVDLEAYDTPGFHDRLLRAQSHIDEHAWQVAQATVRVVTGVVGVVAVSAVLARVAPVLAVVTVVAAAPLWLATRRNTQQLYELAFERTPLERERAYLQRLLSSRREAAELRVFGLGDHLRRRYDVLYGQRLAAVVVVVRRRLLRSLLASSASAVTGTTALVLLAAMVASGRVSLASAGVAVLALSQLQGRVSSLVVAASLLHQAGRFLDDYVSFTELHPIARARQQGLPAPASFETIRVEDLSFTYPGSHRAVLHDIELEVGRGQLIALVGENGSGKTTLAKLLCGLYEPTAGAVLWDDVPLVRLDRAQLHTLISGVFQDYATFPFSARDNVALGDLSRSGDTAGQRRAAERAGIDGVLDRLPAGWDTRLSREYEDGVELSIGQWQRVAMARAFFRDAPFLVLDEPTASLDPRAEAELFGTLRELCVGRTVVLISHRLSAVRDADRIYVLDHGRISERGTHAELMAADRGYAELFALQARSYVEVGTDEGPRSNRAEPVETPG